MAVINEKDLPKIREWHPGKTIVFCSGSFDLPHAGHALFLETCKRHGDILIVLVGTDQQVGSYKDPSRPVLNQHLRLKMIDSLKPVDYAFFVDYTPTAQKFWYKTVEKVFKAVKPEVYVINEDAQDIPRREKMVAEYGARLVIEPRWHPPEFGDISTTGIIKKIREAK